MSIVIILDPTGIDSERVAHEVLNTTHEPIFVCHRNHPLPSYVNALDATVTSVDFADSDSALRDIVDLAKGRDIGGVLTLREYLIPFWSRVCAALSVPGNDPALADVPRNKVSMARQFARYRVPAPRTAVASSHTELRDILADPQLKFPVVVKPAERAGSSGVQIVDSIDGLRQAESDLWDTTPSPYGARLDHRMLVQTCIQGAEYSVESVTSGGVTQHICVTRKATTTGAFRIEIGHTAPATLSPALESRMLSTATRAIQSAGIRNAVSHTEIMVDPDEQCFVLEIAARPGAGTVGHVVKLATGVDVTSLVVRTALGLPSRVERSLDRVAASRLLVPPVAGRLVGVDGLPAVGGDVAMAGLTRPPGTVLAEPTSNYARVGYLIVVGDDEDAVNRRADELLSAVEIEMEPVP